MGCAALFLITFLMAADNELLYSFLVKAVGHHRAFVGSLGQAFAVPFFFLLSLLFVLGDEQCALQFRKLYCGSCNEFVSLC